MRLPFSKKSERGRRQNQPLPRSAFSFYANARAEQPQRGRTVNQKSSQRSWQWLHQLPMILALIAIGISLLWCLGLNSDPKVLQLSNDATPIQQLRESSAYQQAAHQILSKSLMSHTKLTIDTHAVSASLKKQFPEISEAFVNIPLVSRRPIISLRLAEPAILLSDQKGDTYVLDNTGRAIMPAGQLSKLGKFDLLTVSDKSGLAISLNKQILPAQSISFIKEVQAQLKAKQLTPSSYTMPTIANELHVRLQGLPYLVKFNMAEDARQQAGTYLAVKAHLDGEHITPAEYIDVRVPEKAYYK